MENDAILSDSCSLLLGDCVERMRGLPEAQFDLVLTSPPYHVGKEYEKDKTTDQFRTLIDGVFEQAYRLLKPGGYFLVNFGDAFNSGSRFYKAEVPSVFPMTVWYYEWGRK